MFESIPIEPEPVNGRIIKNSVSSDGIPKIPKIGDASFEISKDNPLACKSSTIEKMATRYGKVLMQSSIACFAPETNES